ncbi:MAG: hypothetical protein M1354_02890 [Candidatus Marsarchaeota archaeon]|nr:hypothetical protein [Candidatus Marsarchaeota archaeon]
MIGLIGLAAYAAAPVCGAGCSLSGMITSPYVIGAAIAMAAVLIVMAVLAIIYMISPFLGNTNIKAWIRMKIYDEMASIVFIFIFIAFGALIATYPMASSFASLGLVPGAPTSTNPAGSSCYQAATTPTVIPPTAAGPGQTISNDNLYFLSVCDISYYNGQVNTFAALTFYIAAIASLSPTVSIKYPPESKTVSTGVTNTGEDSGESTTHPGSISPIFTAGVTNTGIGFSAGFPLLPIEPTFHYTLPLINLFYGFWILIEVLQLLIASSGIIYAVLMAVGLVARSFGITKSFGGAMIAFAVGIGVILPIMVSLSYGFIDYAMANAGGQFICSFGFNNLNFNGASCPPSTTLPYKFIETAGDFFGGIFTGNICCGTNTAVYYLSGGPLLLPVFQSFLLFGGLVTIGMSFMPLIIITVVDAFIVDFSKSIGERMDFLSLLTRLA